MTAFGMASYFSEWRPFGMAGQHHLVTPSARCQCQPCECNYIQTEILYVTSIYLPLAGLLLCIIYEKQNTHFISLHSKFTNFAAFIGVEYVNPQHSIT